MAVKQIAFCCSTHAISQSETWDKTLFFFAKKSTLEPVSIAAVSVCRVDLLNIPANIFETLKVITKIPGTLPDECSGMMRNLSATDHEI